MFDAVSSSVSLVAYLALFGGVAVVFLLVNLLVGRLVRPVNPHEEKLEIYECGEPTIGSSFVQFDLRFYVVALLFIIFDVEIAFFFPWATVFGKGTHLMRDEFVVAQRVEGQLKLTPDADALYRELGVRQPQPVTALAGALQADPLYRELRDPNPATVAEYVAHHGARQLVWVTIVDILAFFGVLMVGFVYVWKRGDLNWVRALAQERSLVPESSAAEGESISEPALSA
jgi:NADH-quinone oxidoreductase subunit A